MKSPVAKVLIAVVVLALVGGLGFYLFERNERSGIAAKASEPCGTLDTPESGATLPAGLALPPGQKLLRVQTQGKTSVAFASTAGGRDDIVKVRDDVLALLKTGGFTVKGTDQEPGYEAEAEVAGPVEGTIRVKPLCEGRLEVRYKIEG
jgi:hypothetical protein